MRSLSFKQYRFRLSSLKACMVTLVILIDTTAKGKFWKNEKPFHPCTCYSRTDCSVYLLLVLRQLVHVAHEIQVFGRSGEKHELQQRQHATSAQVSDRIASWNHTPSKTWIPLTCGNYFVALLSDLESRFVPSAHRIGVGQTWRLSGVCRWFATCACDLRCCCQKELQRLTIA